MPDISGIQPERVLNHGRMTIGENTVNYAKYYTPYSGMYQSAGTTSPTIVQISGLYDNSFTGVRNYVGDTAE